MATDSITFRFCPVCAVELTPNVEGVPACPDGHWAAWPDVVAGAGAIPILEGKALIGHRAVAPNKGAYCVLGGFMAPGELPEQTAIREVKEESGLTVKITGLIGVYPGKYYWKSSIDFFYRAEIVGGQLSASDDVSELEWYPINDLPEEIWRTSLPDDQAAFRGLQDWWRLQNQ